MKLRSKSYLFIGTTTLIMVIVFAAVTLYTFRSYSLKSVSDQGRMAAELVLNTLTEQMMSGAMDRHESLLARLNETPGVEHVEVLPSKAIINQFGQKEEDVHEPDVLEAQALASGQAVESLNESWEKVVYNVAIPFAAKARGDVNCLQCHDVAPGTVLGVVRLSVDLTEQRSTGIWAISIIVVLLALFGLLLALSLQRLLSPIVRTATQLKAVVKPAGNGDFSGRLSKRSNDEIGEIAEHTNLLMSSLEQNIGAIFREVETLTGYNHGSNNSNLLQRTVAMVKSMVEASHFKRAIENDRDLDELYARLRRTLKERFGLTRFSLYEVSNSKNRLKLIFAEGLPEDCSLWCKPEILIQGDACRVRRAAHVVSSVGEPEICPSFAGIDMQGEKELMHICVPLLLGGSVGGVLQIVFTDKESEKVFNETDTIRTYLSEAAPVVETKRLMQSLKESTLRDPMTGLYNRRFLEDYLETFTADIARRKVSVGVLMCDVDFFKQVNDTLGHETGDSVLKGVALILKQAVRASDLVIRYGGEEFLALLIDIDEEKAMEVAERIRTSMEAHTFQTTAGPLTKTLSVGVAMYPTDNEGFWGCVKFADVALYQAKETGRNNVVRFTKDMWKEEEQV